MGAAHSKALLYARLVPVIPPCLMMGTDSTTYNVYDKGQRVFADEADRDQFIHALISLLSQNRGIESLADHDFKLFYSRRNPPPPSAIATPPSPAPQQQSKSLFSRATKAPEPDDGSRLVATLVAIDARGVIRAKIEPEADGRTTADAFRAFRRDVEGRLEVLLRNVPSGVGMEVGVGEMPARVVRPGSGGPATAARIQGLGSGDAPPAYGDVKQELI